MSSKDKDEGGDVRVPGGGVSTDQTSIIKYNAPETIISIPRQDGDFNGNGVEGDQIEPTAKPLIQRVPSVLRRKKDFSKYFKPRMIAVGPLHHDDPSLLRAEKLKHKLALNFLEMHGDEKGILDDTIKMEIASLKKCYDQKGLERYDDDSLTSIFVEDGCAVLQAIYLRYAPDIDDEEDELSIKNDLLTFMYQDLFLLENQLPYRVLELLTSSSSHEKPINESIKRFINDQVMTPAEKREPQRWQKRRKLQEEREPVHLLDLLREKRLLVKKEKRNPFKIRLFRSMVSYCIQNRRPNSYTFRNVKELRQAGICLRASETSCLTDISFNRICFVGKLRLPPITVPLLMNMIAYEMCPDFEDHLTVTYYMSFLDSLIDNATDVKELREAGILHKGQGSHDEDVVKLFNEMNMDLVPIPTLYSDVKRQIDNHCRNSWNIYAAQAYQTYFRSPWTFLALVGAIAALLLGALQTYYTINPENQGSAKPKK